MKVQTRDDLMQCIAEALHQEKMQDGMLAAQADIEQRLDTGEVAGFIGKFLQQHWVHVLAEAHASEEDEKIVAVRQVLDDLIWSTTPKATAEERKNLLSRLPAIVRDLSQHLDAINWHGQARQHFFAKLAQRQATYARAALTPRQKIEYAVTVAQRASERLMERQDKPPRMLDEANRTVDAMRQGQWMDFQFTPYSAEPMLRYKLAWISPGHSRFIFVRDDGADFFSIADEDLARALREKEAVCVWQHEKPAHIPVGKPLLWRD
ncbi:DUF1631 family protein [Massilia sp. W12]|uniref:DUF1631 family protein n=1 Tax=Massilia sp. W12 TaxID=3126507 RepID=UPI0030D573F1